MNIVGKWRIKHVDMPRIENEKVTTTRKTREDYLNSDDREDVMMATSLYVFTDTFVCEEWIKLPEDLTPAEMKGMDETELREEKTYLSTSAKSWKEENGKLYLDTNITGEVMGKEASPWVEIKVNEDGTISYENFICILTLERV